MLHLLKFQHCNHFAISSQEPFSLLLDTKRLKSLPRIIILSILIVVTLTLIGEATLVALSL